MEESNKNLLSWQGKGVKIKKYKVSLDKVAIIREEQVMLLVSGWRWEGGQGLSYRGS